MAFDSASVAAARVPLMEIALSGTTLRYADQHITLDDGTRYDKRIISFPTIQVSLGRLLDAEFRRPGVTVVLDDADGAISALFEANDGFAGKAITLKVVSGTTSGHRTTYAAADVETRFVGSRRFPGGASWDDGRFTMSIEWDLKSDMRTLPRQVFFRWAYPRIEAKAKDLPIPWIYGDWQSTVTENTKVPCYQVDSATGVGGAFKIAEELQSIEQVYKNGVAAAYTATDATAGEFTLDEAYDPLIDTIEAHVLGATTATFTGAGAEFSLPRLAYDLLTNSKLLGLSTGRINTTAFADWENELEPTALGRRWIGSDTSAATLLAELMSDGLADLYLNTSNEYTPIYRKRDLPVSVPQFRAADLAPAGEGVRAYTVQVDPEQTYANVVTGAFAKKPETGEFYAATVSDEATSAIANVGTRHSRRLRMGWLYTLAGAEPRTQLELIIYSREVQSIQIRLGPPGLQLDVTDQFSLAYGTFEKADGSGTVFQVRDITYDYGRMEAEVQAWNLDPLTSGIWMSDVAPNWATATASQRAASGFWTNDSGLADPADDDSDDSKWF